MLNNATLNQLKDLRLNVMADGFKEQLEKRNIASLSFEERFGLLVEAEWLERLNKRTERLIKNADFRFTATIEDINYTNKTGVSKGEIIKLSLGGYVKKAQNVFFCGPTGVGKTYLACALGRSACLQGIQVFYVRIPDFFNCVSAAHFQGRQIHFRDKCSKVPVLILDDWGLKKFTLEETAELSNLFERRYGRVSTIISSQVPSTEWHELFPDPTQADSILDRIVHNAYPYNITGESMRKTIGKRGFEKSDI